MMVVVSAICAAVSFTSEARQIRVACIGDSITVSKTNASVPGMYPNTLQELLGDDYLVGNFGEGGTTGNLWSTDWKTAETRITNRIQPYIEDFQTRVAANLGTAVPLVELGAYPWGSTRFDLNESLRAV